MTRRTAKGIPFGAIGWAAPAASQCRLDAAAQAEIGKAASSRHWAAIDIINK